MAVNLLILYFQGTFCGGQRGFMDFLMGCHKFSAGVVHIGFMAVSSVKFVPQL